MPSPTEITVPQLSRLIGTPSAPIIIDVRIDEDFALDPDIVPTAFRYSFQKISTLIPDLLNQQVVVYCQKGKKMSQGVIALLRNAGIKAESLQGGHFAWRDAGELLVPAKQLPALDQSGSSLWVTKIRPKIDRIACPWLIRRFIDPKAKFLFVTAPEVLAVAEKFNAIPFDVEDVFWTHRGDECTFDTMLTEFGLNTTALKQLASIVRGADTNQHDLTPESAGLLAVSLGLSRMYRDDNEQLDAGMLIYDTLYRWARDATGETHDWPQSGRS